MARVIATFAALAVVASAGSAALSSAKAPVHGKGRLLAPVLVFFEAPAKKKNGPFSLYHVYFRTAAGFMQVLGDGSHHPGRIEVDEASDDDSEAISMLGGGEPSGRCYHWVVSATHKRQPRLTKKRIGDKVRVRLRLYATTPQVRTVRLQTWPASAYADPSASVKRAVRKIGCRA